MGRLSTILLAAALLAFAGLYGFERVGCLDDADHHQLHHGTTVQACTHDRFAARLKLLDRWLGRAPFAAVAGL